MQPHKVRIALPSKGRMEGETLEFLANCGLRVNKTNPRQYSASMPTFPDVQVLFQRPRDIPSSIAAGDVDLGITGYDTVAEAAVDLDDMVIIHDALGYGECALVLAVPMIWQDVVSLDDLAMRARSETLRVATKYERSVQRFLEQAGVEGVRIVHADGALEAAPSIGYADFIADITSTGTTLRENNLRPLENGTVVKSQAVFIGNRAALATRPEVLSVTEQMLEFIEAYLQARGRYMIFANMRGESIEDIASRVLEQPDLGGLQWPTISPLVTGNQQANWWSINLVVPHHRLYAAIQQIRAIDGSGVVVTPVTYIFEERPARCQRLLATVQRQGK
ncbi:MAG: ATP phosphoribosyltransferase [Chloroflexi bacterium]|nr:ATP phosphoribosyltransferase [Chloroflexota bacterium]